MNEYYYYYYYYIILHNFNITFPNTFFTQTIIEKCCGKNYLGRIRNGGGGGGCNSMCVTTSYAALVYYARKIKYIISDDCDQKGISFEFI